MNDREILNRLWEAHRGVQSDWADSGEVKHGYRIKRVASTVYKMV